MKKIYSFIVFVCFGFAVHGQTINSGLTVTAQQSVDAKSYKLSGNKHVPYASSSEFLSIMPSTRRHIGQIAYVANGSLIEAWQFVGGITDADFKKVTSGIPYYSGGGGGGKAVLPGYAVTIDSTSGNYVVSADTSILALKDSVRLSQPLYVEGDTLKFNPDSSGLVKDIYKKAGTDSVYKTINGVDYFAYKDSSYTPEEIRWSVIDSINNPASLDTTIVGDTYLVGTAASGAFSGQANKIATFDGSTWTFDAASTGDLLYNAYLSVTDKYNGSAWVRIPNPPLVTFPNQLVLFGNGTTSPTYNNEFSYNPNSRTLQVGVGTFYTTSTLSLAGGRALLRGSGSGFEFQATNGGSPDASKKIIFSNYNRSWLTMSMENTFPTSTARFNSTFSSNIYPSVTDSFRLGSTTKIWKYGAFDSLYIPRNAAAGKVLTSDGDGWGTWQDAAGGGGAVTYQFTRTKAQIDALITGDSLVAGAMYKITGVHPTLYDDGTTSGTTIFLKAATSNKLETQGHGLFYNPKYDQSVEGFGVWTDLMSGTFSGVTGNFDVSSKETVTANNGATGNIYAEGLIQWVSGDWSAATSITGATSGTTATVSGFTSPSYSIGDKVFWGQYVWQNVNGNVGAKTDILNLDAEWTKLPYDTVNYKIVIDVIGYDYANDMIVMRHELEADNIVTMSKGDADFWLNDQGYPYNPISVFMWGNTYDYNTSKGVGGNKVYGSCFESTDFRGGVLYTNILRDGSYIQTNSFNGSGYIQNTSLSGGSFIQYLTLNGSSFIQYLTLNGSSFQNLTLNGGSGFQYLTLNGGSGFQNLTLNGGSSFQYLTLNGGSGFQNLTLNGGSGFQNLTLNDISYIQNNSISGNSIIYNNTFQNGAILEIGLSNPITGKTIQKNTFISTTPFNIDMSAATLIYGDYEKTFYKRPDGTNKVRYYNNSDTLVIGNVTD